MDRSGDPSGSDFCISGSFEVDCQPHSLREEADEVKLVPILWVLLYLHILAKEIN